MSINSKVLAVLSATEGSFAHQVVSRTGIDAKQVNQCLSRLYQVGRVKRRREPDEILFRYYLGGSEATHKAEPHVPRSHVTVYDSMTDSAIMHKMSMLRKMRGRLIEEWHPLIDAVIQDYEWFLRSVRR